MNLRARVKIRVGAEIIFWLMVFLWFAFGLYWSYLLFSKEGWPLSDIFLEASGIIIFIMLVYGAVSDVFITLRFERMKRFDVF